MNDVNRLTNYSLLALLMLTIMAYIYVVHIINVSSYANEPNSKIVAAFNA